MMKLCSMSLNSRLSAEHNVGENISTRRHGHKQTRDFHERHIESDSGNFALTSKLPSRLTPAVTALVLILLTAPGWGSPHKRSAKNAGGDSGYVLALGIADRFLHAWEIGDLETGMVLLTDRARHTRSADTLEDFFSAGQDRGFEIMRGSSHAGRYRFPVVLLTRQGNSARRIATEIVLVSTGKNEWAVDKLP
jgi:hypothetical protein